MATSAATIQKKPSWMVELLTAVVRVPRRRRREAAAVKTVTAEWGAAVVRRRGAVERPAVSGWACRWRKTGCEVRWWLQQLPSPPAVGLRMKKQPSNRHRERNFVLPKHR